MEYDNTHTLYHSWFDILHRTSNDNYFVLDVATQFSLVDCNDALMRSGAIARTKRLGLALPEPVSKDDERAAQSRYLHCVKSRSPVSYEEPVMGADGRLQYWHTQVLPVIDAEHGEVVQLIGVARNVTGLKSANNFTSWADQSKNQFFATIGQDIREQLDILNSQLAKVSAPSHGIKDPLLGDLRNALSQLSGICDGIEEMVSVDVMVKGSAPLDLRLIVEQSKELMLAAALARGSDIEIAIDSNVPACLLLGDSACLSKVLRGLLASAIEVAANANGRPISLAVFGSDREWDDSFDIRIEVISPMPSPPLGLDEPANVFVSGFQPLAEFYLAEELTQRLGGTLRVVRGAGTLSFQIDFRMDVCVPEKKLCKTLLLVDDDEVSAFVAKEMLNKDGWSVITADDGSVALELASKNKVDVILMDVQMPGMNGIEATRRIREMGISIPIIAYTADVMRDNCERCLEAGMNEILTKPIKQQKLIERMNFWAQMSERKIK